MKRAKFFLLGLLLAIVASWIFSIGLLRHNPYIYLIPAVLPFLLTGFLKPEWMLSFALLILTSRLVLPGLPGELELVHVIFLFAGGVICLRCFITKEKLKSDALLRYAALGYAGVALYTMFARGIGFRLLGDGQAGGMRYIVIYLGLIVIWFVPNITISRKRIKYLLILSSICSFLPVLAELIFITSRGVIQQQYWFIRPGFGLEMSLIGLATGEGVRFWSATVLGTSLIYLPFFLFDLKKENYFKYIFLIVLGVGIGAFSGFRSVLIGNISFLFVYGYLFFRKNRYAYVSCWAAAGVCGYFLVFISYEILPFGMQRSLSFLPFIGDGSEALRDGASTIGFRFGVWELAIKNLPRYLILGRGLAFDWNELQMVSQSHWMSDQLLISGYITNLHNSVLELILYMGIPGTIFFTFFVIRGFKLANDFSTLERSDNEYYRIGLLYVSMFISGSILFLVSFGNPYSTFLNFCIYLSIIRLLINEKEPQECNGSVGMA